MQPSESIEAGLEGGHSVADQINKLIDRFSNRLTLENLKLIERYLKGELHILVNLRARGSDIEYVALFQWAQNIGRSDIDRPGWKNECGFDRQVSKHLVY